MSFRLQLKRDANGVRALNWLGRRFHLNLTSYDSEATGHYWSWQFTLYLRR